MSAFTKQLLLFFIIFIQSVGMKCENILCGHPGQPVFGFYSPAKYYYNVNETVQYTCFTNYHLVGYHNRTCTPSGDWDVYIPLCLKPEKISKFVSESQTWNKTVRLLSDNDKKTCIQWKPNNNGYLLEITLNQTINLMDVKYIIQHDSTNMIRENIRFYISKESIMSVDETTQSLSTEEECKDYIKSTKYLGGKLDNNINVNFLTFQVVNYSSCFRLCELYLYRADGNSCGWPEVPLHGIVDRKSKTHTKAVYSCEEGYSIKGNNVRYCLNGEWSDKPPHCIQKNVENSLSESNMNVPTLFVSILISLCLFIIIVIIIFVAYKIIIKKRNDHMKRNFSSNEEDNRNRSKDSSQNKCKTIPDVNDDTNIFDDSAAHNMRVNLDDEGYMIPDIKPSAVYDEIMLI